MKSTEEYANLVKNILCEPESEMVSEDQIIEMCFRSYYGSNAESDRDQYLLKRLRIWVGYLEQEDFTNISYYKLLTIDEAYYEDTASMYNYFSGMLKSITQSIHLGKPVTIEIEKDKKIILHAAEEFTTWRNSRWYRKQL